MRAAEWDSVRRVCERDPFAQKRLNSPWDVPWPWCRACGVWMDSARIQSRQHQRKLEARELQRQMEAASSGGDFGHRGRATKV